MIRTRLQGDTPFFPNMLNNGKVEVCLKEDVDKTLAEKDNEIAELKAKLEDANELVNKAHDTIARGIKASSTRERRLRRRL